MTEPAGHQLQARMEYQDGHVEEWTATSPLTASEAKASRARRLKDGHRTYTDIPGGLIYDQRRDDIGVVRTTLVWVEAGGDRWIREITTADAVQPALFNLIPTT